MTPYTCWACLDAMFRGVILLIVLAVFSFGGMAGAADEAGKILILKKERKMFLQTKDGSVLKEYGISLGFEPVGHKQQQGDGRTPEGSYKITWKNPNSSYYKSLKISYPNEEDRRKAKELGVDPGGDIFIHGLPNGMGAIGKAHLLRDWTLGCIAITSDEMDEVWELVRVGVPVEIRP